MDMSEVLRFIDQHRHIVMVTLREDGTPQLSPIDGVVDEQGHVLFRTREKAHKLPNLRRDPRAWMCVLSRASSGEWLQVEGRVTIIPLPDAMPGLEYHHRRIVGEHPDWPAFRARMKQERRVLLRFDVVRASGPPGW